MYERQKWSMIDGVVLQITNLRLWGFLSKCDNLEINVLRLGSVRFPRLRLRDPKYGTQLTQLGECTLTSHQRYETGN